MADGKIHYRGRAKQLRDFSGLRFGNITPTDIDGIIEYKNKAYIIIEGKKGEAPFLGGQKLALDRLSDDVRTAGKQTLLILYHHNVDDCTKDVNVAEQSVSSYKLNGKWNQPQFGQTVRQLCDQFIFGLEEVFRNG